jgi:hypothetical protein
MLNDRDRANYEKVAKMTDFELAQIEADEMHPMYEFACEEIDVRMNTNGKGHVIDGYNESDEWANSFKPERYDVEQQRREADADALRQAHFDRMEDQWYELENDLPDPVPFY